MCNGSKKLCHYQIHQLEACDSGSPFFIFGIFTWIIGAKHPWYLVRVASQQSTG